MNASSKPQALIDVLSADSFAEEHLAGAVNFCVYETAFIDKIRAAFPDHAAHLVVYGLSDSTREAGEALEKLSAAGYKNVTALPGGLEGCKASGQPLERTAAQSAPASGRFAIDRDASFIRWTGRNLFNFHTGELKLGDGHVTIERGELKDAIIAVDMNSISCADLTDSQMNATLIGHLRTTDFFEVEKHPTAEFKLTSATLLGDATDGTPNYHFSGDFTLRGKSQPIAFDASVAEKEPGVYVAQTTLDLDRTLWGSHYGSGKFFARLGQHVVNDLIHLQLKVVTKPGT